MICVDKCRYDNKIIYIFDFFDENEQISSEHVQLLKNAGSIFLGKNVPEALGDYFAGPNHTLPTSGTARFSSPLSVDDFVKKSSFIYYTREALGQVQARIADFAEREGLHAHAKSVTIRYEAEKMPKKEGEPL